MSGFDHRYGVALSYSREDREVGHALAAAFRGQGITVYLDQWAVAQVWDGPLFAYLHDLHRATARYCLPLVSCNYVEGMSAEEGSEAGAARGLRGWPDYLLPIRLDDSYVPALRLAGPYLDIRQICPADIARVLMRILEAAPDDSEPAGEIVQAAPASDPPDDQTPGSVPGFDRVPAIDDPHGSPARGLGAAPAAPEGREGVPGLRSRAGWERRSPLVPAWREATGRAMGASGRFIPRPPTEHPPGELPLRLRAREHTRGAPGADRELRGPGAGTLRGR